MKKTSLVLLSVMTLALASASWARPPHDGPAIERLTETLNLDQQQVGQVTQILQEQRDKRDTLHDTMRTQMRADMQALHQETIQRLGSVLSPEQLQKFTQLSEARRARREARALKHPMPAPAQ